MRSGIFNSTIKRKKSSIVWFIDHLGYGGTQQVLLRVSRKLARLGYTQAIVCLNDAVDNNIRSQLKNLGIEVRVVGKKSLIFGIGLLSLWFWLRRRRFDVCVTLLFFSDILGFLPKLFTKTRFLPQKKFRLRRKKIYIFSKKNIYIYIYILTSGWALYIFLTKYIYIGIYIFFSLISGLVARSASRPAAAEMRGSARQ